MKNKILIQFIYFTKTQISINDYFINVLLNFNMIKLTM